MRPLTSRSPRLLATTTHPHPARESKLHTTPRRRATSVRPRRPTETPRDPESRSHRELLIQCFPRVPIRPMSVFRRNFCRPIMSWYRRLRLRHCAFRSYVWRWWRLCLRRQRLRCTPWWRFWRTRLSCDAHIWCSRLWHERWCDSTRVRLRFLPPRWGGGGDEGLLAATDAITETLPCVSTAGTDTAALMQAASLFSTSRALLCSTSKLDPSTNACDAAPRCRISRTKSVHNASFARPTSASEYGSNQYGSKPAMLRTYTIIIYMVPTLCRAKMATD